MKWTWPLVSRRELEYVEADRDRIRAERDQFLKDRNTHKAVAQTAARRFTDADSELAAARTRITQLTNQLDAIREQQAVDQQSGRTNWRSRCQQAEKRADRLQRQLDDALGLTPTVIKDSSQWQPGFKAPTPDRKGSAS